MSSSCCQSKLLTSRHFFLQTPWWKWILPDALSVNCSQCAGGCSSFLKCSLVAKYSPQQFMLVYCVTHWHPLAKLCEPPWNVLWAWNQPPVPDPYSQSLVCATWTIPRASTHISLPQSYESEVLTSPFSLIAHFFPGLTIIYLTPFALWDRWSGAKTTDRTFSSL